MSTTSGSALDRPSLERLYGQLEKPVYNVVYRWVWDREEARELVQEAFIRLWRMRARVEMDSVKPLLFRIAVNLAASRRRWRKMWRLCTLDALRGRAGDDAAADERLEEARRQRALRDAVDRLPERLRRVVALCELGGMSYAEVAAVLDVPAGTVASRRNAALERLREALGGSRPVGAAGRRRRDAR